MSDPAVAEALQMGWVPQEEWKGDPDKWRPAAEFVQRGEKVIPILKDRLNKVESELKVALSANRQEIERVKAEAYARATEDYNAKLRALDEKEVEAFKAGDGDAFVAAKKERAAIKPPAPPIAAAPPPDPVFEDWQAKNPWYQADPELADYADFISHRIVAEHGGVIDPAKLGAEMTERVKRSFPHKFTNPRRDEPGVVEGGGAAGKGATGPKGQTFADLPADAKATYTRLAAKAKAQGREFTKDQYAAAYYE